MNIAIISGNLAADPEVKTPGDKAVCNFRVGTREYGGKTEWHNCVAWDKSAEFMGNFLKKGDRINVKGRLQTRSWEKDGVKRYTTEIVCDVFGGIEATAKKSDSSPVKAHGGNDDIPI